LICVNLRDLRERFKAKAKAEAKVLSRQWHNAVSSLKKLRRKL
jgi:hypothetical protein